MNNHLFNMAGLNRDVTLHFLEIKLEEMYHATQGFPVIKQICKYFQFQLTHYLRADWEPGESPKPWLEGAPFWEAFSNVHCYYLLRTRQITKHL